MKLCQTSWNARSQFSALQAKAFCSLQVACNKSDFCWAFNYYGFVMKCFLLGPGIFEKKFDAEARDNTYAISGLKNCLQPLDYWMIKSNISANATFTPNTTTTTTTTPDPSDSFTGKTMLCRKMHIFDSFEGKCKYYLI